jgi:hypothetical protein
MNCCPNARFFFSLHPSASLSFWQHDNHNSTRPCQTQFSFFLSSFLSCYRYLSINKLINKLTTGREDDNPSQHAAQFSFLVVLQYWSQFSLFLLSSVRLLSADIVYPFSEHKSEAMLCIAPSSCPIGVNFLQHVRLHLSGGPLHLIDDTCVSKINHIDDQLI